MVFQPGSAAKVAAGSELVFQIHYTATGKPATDQSKIGFIFAKEPPRTEIRASSFLNSMLKIPAGSPDHAVDSAIEFTQDSHITALFPHTHLRGKSWEYRLIYPDGQSRVVLSVPHYDFNWQTYYRFTAPIAAPKGSRLEATAHYDNSVNNRSNPDPTIDVRWGEQTWQEMQYSGISYYVDGNAKPAPAATAGRPVALKAADMSGKWTGELRTPAGLTLPIAFMFKLDGDKVTGTVTLPMGDFAIADGKMDGERLQFGVSVNANGQQLVFRCAGQLSNEDQLKITMNGQMNFEVNAKRST